MDHRRWKILPPAPAAFLAETRLPPLATQLLYNRGISEPAQAGAFLDQAEDLQVDPFLLPDMDRAVARVHRALLGAETIAVYGDFDADGICGTALLTQGLSLLGGRVIPYIPHRVEEGYGLNSASLDNLCAQGVTLVVTVDCGISNILEVEYARSRGLDVIITDHHTVSQGVPPALAVVNPKRPDSVYPFTELAGVGVAFKFLQALFQSLGRVELLDNMLDIVAVGTVADMVPLLGENRYLVKRGLDALRNTQRLGLQEMLRAAGLLAKRLDSGHISWIIAPRLNAPGRLEHALASFDLLMTDSAEAAREMAGELEETNAERQRLTRDFFARAKEEIAASGADSPLLMAGGEDYPSGVVGLIAGRLVEDFYRPSIVIKKDEDTSRGSARSIPGFDIIAALGQCQDILMRFGGHPMAAGFTVHNDNLDRLRQRLVAMAADQLSTIDLQPFLTLEAEVPLSAINGEVYRMVERFAPFGIGNPVPVFLSRQVKVVDSNTVGKGSSHLRLKLREGGLVWRGIGFDLGHLIGEVIPQIDIAYHLSVDRWGGEETLALNILDFAPSPS